MSIKLYNHKEIEPKWSRKPAGFRAAQQGKNQYDHQVVERKWQERWDKEKSYEVGDIKGKRKFYCLDMFPYPSGVGLHVGHPEGYTASDIYSRYLRMAKDYNVLHPMGWDAFGLPAENYAIKTGRYPAEVTAENILNFKRQIKSLGFSYDWSREIDTTDSKYYKWTQWIFLKLFKRGLAYEAEAPINWCPSCKTGLANEEVTNNECQRCGSPTAKKNIRQWILKITKYADRLLADLEDLDWPEPIKLMQRNWIGKSEGAEVRFRIPINANFFVVKLGFKTQLNNKKTTWFLTFPTKGREPVFQTKKEVSTIMKLFFNGCLRHNFSLHEVSVMKEHLHLIIDTDKNIPIEKIYKYLKGYTSKKFHDYIKDNFKTAPNGDDPSNDYLNFGNLENSKGFHLWTPKGDYSIIKNQEEYQKILKYVQGNPEKKELIKQERLLSKNLDKLNCELYVFTTRPDTLFGATFMVLSPEHELVQKLKPQITNWSEVEKYIAESKNKSDLERTDLAKEKTGVELKGVKAVNPVNDQEIPVFIADYVLAFYGTGAIMAVPAHDERDFAFAKKYQIPIIQTVALNLDDYNRTIKNLKVLEKIQSAAKMANVKFWVSGGLACAFYAGVIYRWHEDLDLITKDELSFNKLVEIFGNLGFKKIREKKISDQLTTYIFQTKEGIEIDIGINKNEFGLRDSDFELYPKKLNDYFALVISKRFVKSFKEMQLKERMKEKDKLDYEFLNGRIVTEEGCGVNSEQFNDLPTQEFKDKIIHWLEEKDLGKKATNYKLRDWVFSRQRYWGEPIPLIHCEKCGIVPLDEKDLPLKLPEVKNYQPTGTGESPLANIKDWVNTVCPKCGGPAKRETNTMPQWAGSCWYYLRYLDPNNDKEFASKDKLKYWLPVDLYIGGAEHAVLHLLYARFWHKVLYDEGLVPTKEPFMKLVNQGMILGEDNQKMSKSRGNVINPDDVIKEYGADTLRLYEMFMGPLEMVKPWSTRGVIGVRRFVDKVWALQDKMREAIKQETRNKKQETNKIQISNSNIDKLVHKTIKKVGEDIENFRFNTAISAMMILANEFGKQEIVPVTSYQLLVTLLSPFAPHLTEEIWERLGHKDSIFKEKWPKYDESIIQEDEIELVVQINGKVRDKIKVSADIDEAGAVEIAKKSEKVQKWLIGKEPKKVIFVKGKLLNIVI